MEISKQITKVCVFFMLTVIISVVIVMVARYFTTMSIMKEKERYYDSLQSQMSYERQQALNSRSGLWSANEDKNGKVDSWAIDWIYEAYYKELDFIAKKYNHEL